MANVTRGPDTTSVDSLPIDVELISDSTNAALKMELSTSTREAIDARTTVIVGQLNLLLSEELGADEDPEVKGVFRKAHQLLDLSSRPTRQTPSFSAFFYMRDVASLTRRLLWVYAERTGADVA